MSEYVPTTEDIYGSAAYGAVTAMIEDGLVPDEAQFRVMFDRWLAAHDAEVAAKAVTELAEELIEVAMPEQGSHINMTSYREGLVDGVNRSVIATNRRAAEYRKAVQS